MRSRFLIVPAVLVLALPGLAREAAAAAEVHRLSLVLSTVPTQVKADDFNGLIGEQNTRLAALGLEPLSKIKLSWMADAELRYFVRQNVAVSLGVSRLRANTSQEYLPAIGQSNTLSSDVTSIPIHAGAAYYFTPYNKGDFQARAYLGGGFITAVNNRATLEWKGTGLPAGQRPFRWTGSNDGPGYYGEFGAHLFFASKLSVLLSGLHRSNLVRNLVDEDTGAPILDAQGRPVSLDAGGSGFRMGLAIGL